MAARDTDDTTTCVGIPERGAKARSTGLWLFAIGIVALSLESFGVALVLFGIAGWMLS
jgi:hypothetical protein